jgi:tetratricopeptide (TPR) repeat protein
MAAALLTHGFAFFWVDSLDERLATSARALELAQQADDVSLLILSHGVRINDLVELGDMVALDRELDLHEGLAKQHRLPHSQWAARCRRAMRAIMSGAFDEGERLAGEALALGQRSAANQANSTYAVQMFLVRREQDRLAEVEPVIDELAAQFPFPSEFDCYRALLLSDTGRLEEARNLFERLAQRDFAAIPRNFLWLPSIALLAEVCATLGDGERAVRLYELLAPYAGRNVSGGGSVTSHGALSYYLGVLATLRGDWVCAEQHLLDAIALNERMGAAPFLADSYRAYAEFLWQRNADGDRGRAQEWLAQASQLAGTLGMVRLQRRLAAGVPTAELTANGGARSRA